MDLVEKNLYEACSSKKTYLSHLMPFGCEAFVHVLKEKRRKIDNKSKKCILIEYKDGVKVYKLWNLVTRKLIYSIDAIFKEFRGTSKVEDVKIEREPQKVELELNGKGHDLDELIEFDEEL